MNLTVFQNSQSERFSDKVETYFEKVETISGPSDLDFLEHQYDSYYMRMLVGGNANSQNCLKVQISKKIFYPQIRHQNTR